MDKIQKIRAEIEAKLSRLDEGIHYLTQKAKRQNKNNSTVSRQTMEKIQAKRDEAATRLKSLNRSNNDHHQNVLSDLKHFMSDVDAELREALAYYK